MEDRYLLIRTDLVEYQRSVVLEIQCIDGDMMPENDFFHVCLVDERIKEADFSLRVDFQQSLAECFRLVLPYIRMDIVLPVQIAFLHFIPIHNCDILESEPQGAFPQ